MKKTTNYKIKTNKIFVGNKRKIYKNLHFSFIILSQKRLIINLTYDIIIFEKKNTLKEEKNKEVQKWNLNNGTNSNQETGNTK